MTERPRLSIEISAKNRDELNYYIGQYRKTSALYRAITKAVLVKLRSFKKPDGSTDQRAIRNWLFAQIEE